MGTNHRGSDGLTKFERRFVAAYAGNATQAAIAAGYSKKIANPIGCELMAKENIKQALSHRDLSIPESEKRHLDKLITDRNERLLWLVSQLRDEGHHIKDRLKAYDMLAKSCGDYLEPAQPTLSPDSQAPPTVIVIKAGREATTNICIEGPKKAIDAAGEALPADLELVGAGDGDGDEKDA